MTLPVISIVTKGSSVQALLDSTSPRSLLKQYPALSLRKKLLLGFGSLQLIADSFDPDWQALIGELHEHIDLHFTEDILVTTTQAARRKLLESDLAHPSIQAFQAVFSVPYFDQLAPCFDYVVAVLAQEAGLGMLKEVSLAARRRICALIEEIAEPRNHGQLILPYSHGLYQRIPDWIFQVDRRSHDLATRLHETNELAQLPILADSLQEAGCHDHSLLEHLRQPIQHSRGCWALDALLGLP